LRACCEVLSIIFPEITPSLTTLSIGWAKKLVVKMIENACKDLPSPLDYRASELL
jgi:hypothetical protein